MMIGAIRPVKVMGTEMSVFKESREEGVELRTNKDFLQGWGMTKNQ